VLLYEINWAGLAAFGTACAGILAAWAAVVRARSDTRKQADEECERKLLEARNLVMEMSDQLYEIEKKAHARRRSQK
jgi:hypothetical protein